MSGQNRENIPTVQGRDTPVPVGGVGAQVGPARPSSNYYLASQVGNQAGMQESPDTGMRRRTVMISGMPEAVEVRDAEMVTPHNKKRKALQVSPSFGWDDAGPMHSRARNISSIELQWDEQEKKSAVRKAEGSEKRRASIASEESLRDRPLKLMKKIEREVKALAKTVRDNRNTKVEIKDTTERLVSYVGQMMTREVQESLDWGERVITPKIIMIPDTNEMATQTNITKSSETGTQTDPEVARPQDSQNIRKAQIIDAVHRGGTYADYERIFEERWPKEAFKKVTVAAEDVFSKGWEWDLALLTTADLCMDGEAAEKYRERFQGIEELREQGATAGGVAYITEKRSFPKSDGSTREIGRSVFYAMAADRINDVISMMDVFESVNEIKRRMLQGNREKLVLTSDGRIELWCVRKIVEFAFAETDIEVRLVAEAKNKMRARNMEEKRTSRQKDKSEMATRKRKEYKDEGIMVRVGGAAGTYADLLKKVKDTINLKDTGADISGIRKTRTGDLLISVRRGGEGAGKLLSEIRSKVGGARNMGQDLEVMTMHIGGVDGITSAEEVMEAVKVAMNNDEAIEGAKIAMRPAAGERQNASLTIPRQAGQELLKIGKIKVGWVSCPIRERVEVARCYRCWEAHGRRSCSGTDRSKLCHRCGGEGHKAAECERKPFCPLCGREGHRANSTGCPIFRKHLAKQRLTRDARGQEGREQKLYDE